MNPSFHYTNCRFLTTKPYSFSKVLAPPGTPKLKTRQTGHRWRENKLGKKPDYMLIVN